jgi:hypothetical protein
MLLLQSLDKFGEVGELDMETGQFRCFAKADRPDLETYPIGGHFAELSEALVCFYRSINGKLYLKLDAEDFELLDDVVVSHRRENATKSRLTVLHRGVLIFDWLYRRPTINPPLGLDPTPFIDEEDFDIALMISKVMNDRGRRDRIYR